MQGRSPGLASWVGACAAAEAVGMTAAAAAARAGEDLGGATAWALVIGGGLVEGAALGFLQGRALRGLLGRRRAWAWAAVTLAVAGLGWAAVAAPATLGASQQGPVGPTPWVLVTSGAAGLGLVMGALLGAVQSAVLRGVVSRPLRWIAASSVGWVPAMVVIFIGASAPSAATPTGWVVVLGTATGALAGGLLGALTWPVLRSFTGQTGDGCPSDARPSLPLGCRPRSDDASGSQGTPAGDECLMRLR